VSGQDPLAPDPIAPGRVAVVTGAASGIGFGLAERFAAEGMHVVLADVEEPALTKAATALAGSGASVLPVVTDVASLAAVETLRDAALSAFGAVHVVCNNAGVGGPHGPLWECPPGEWDWVLGVNLNGIMNGVRAFMPVLLAQDTGHMMNTSSIFGVFAGALGPYGVSKHGVDRDAAFQPEVPRRHARRRVGALPGRGADQLRHLVAEPAGAGGPGGGP
jgi:NAD(P)-dependent dehydrogenase (short-subunit alcohol dehydrogenase family)